MTALDALLALLAALVIVPAAVLCLEIVAASRRRRDDGETNPPRTGSIAVLMPAHDEAAGIERSIRAVLAQLRAGDRLLVVADNCSDRTAEVARAAGAQVVERRDPALRGKGYALDFGVRALERDPPRTVLIVDADCLLEPLALDRLAAQCEACARPVQAQYLMRAPAGAALNLRIAQFAWLVKNKLRPLGGAALGWPCQLMGTGMAFPWDVIRRAPLASGHLVEDLQLGVALALDGHAPAFCPGALVTSVFPTDPAAVASQRTRWEHGHLAVIAALGPRLLGGALRRRDARLLGMALDLMVPPLAALVLGIVALLVVAAAWRAIGGSGVAAAIAIVALLLIGLGVMLAWARDGRAIVTSGELARMPFYIASKLPVYVRLFTRRQVEWVRTKRDDSGR
ncbi:MAG TPA: glycosyltransferase family 2 protein [Burkholderiaceae bacterium]|nr:glycosyltransferase family 2 protein [Burkholderiaceae bacterium]